MIVWTDQLLKTIQQDYLMLQDKGSTNERSLNGESAKDCEM